MAKVLDPHQAKRKDTIVFSDPSVTSQNEPEEQKHFSQLKEKSNNVLLSIKTVFPFDFFPDTLVVDPVKISYKANILFSSGYTQSIPITDISTVIVESAVLFSTLCISFVTYPTQEIRVKPLWKKDAEKARDIISGLIVANKAHLDVDKIPIPDTTALEEVGESHT